MPTAHGKQSPVPYVLALSPEARAAFLHGCLLSDGHVNAKGYELISQNDGEVQDAIVLAATLSGYHVHITGNLRCKRLYLSRKQFVVGQALKIRLAGTGEVWCPQTQYGTWVMRQGTEITITGNTSYGGKAAKMIEGIEKMVLEHPESGLQVPTLDEAKFALATHRRLYKQYWTWTSWVVARTRDLGYSETAFGRPRFLPLIDSPREDDRSEAERQAINHQIQGSSADLMKMAMVNISKDRRMNEWGQMVLQVHDEIVSIVRTDMVESYKQRITTHMELKQPFEPYVRLEVDVNAAFDWGACHK